MQCLNPIRILNPAKSVLHLSSPSYTQYIDVPCQDCLHCRKNKANDWKIRLFYEIKYGLHNGMSFITLTFDEPSYAKFKDNPQIAIRRFFERYRKAHGKSCRHWIITELGGETGRLHFHGILFSPVWLNYVPKSVINGGQQAQKVYETKQLRKYWGYGRCDVGTHVNDSTVSYLTKYLLKGNPTDITYRSKIFTSQGMGRSFLSPENIKTYRSLGDVSRRLYHNNIVYSMPRYFAQKIWTPEELVAKKERAMLEPKVFKFKNVIYSDEDTYNKAVNSYYHLTVETHLSVDHRNKKNTLDYFIQNDGSRGSLPYINVCPYIYTDFEDRYTEDFRQKLENWFIREKEPYSLYDPISPINVYDLPSSVKPREPRKKTRIKPVLELRESHIINPNYTF